MNISLRINPRRVAKIMLSIIAILLIFHSMYVFTQLVYGYKLRHIFKFFDLNSEGNLPTVYQVGALITSSLLLLFVAFIKKNKKDKFAIHWLVLGVIFFLLAFDEAAKMHEQLNLVFRSMLPQSTMDFLYFAWVIPYAILAVTIAFMYSKFLFHLPKRTAFLFISSGAIYILGAIGFEMLTSYYRGVGFTIQLIITIEETLEMLGIVYFIYSVLDYIKTHIGSVLHISPNSSKEEYDDEDDELQYSYQEEQQRVTLK